MDLSNYGKTNTFRKQLIDMSPAMIGTCLLYTSRHDTPLDDRIPFPEPEDSALDEDLRRLTPKYRAAVHLFYYEGYTAEEIARMSGEKQMCIRDRKDAK